MLPKDFREKEEFQILSSQSDLGKPSYCKQSLWMAHWTRASSSVELKSGKSCSPFEEISNVDYSKDCGSFPFELTKAKMAERLMLGVSNAGTSAGNKQRFSSKMRGVTHNVSQGVECKNADPVHGSFDTTMVQKNINLYTADTLVSERFSVHKISDVSVNSCKVLSTDNLSSEWDHFPMFEINRKIDSILNPRHSSFITSSDKSFVSQRALKVNMSTSDVMTFSSKEYEFHSHQVTDKNNSKCKSAGGILSNQDIDLSSDLVRRKLKGQSIEESCSCSKNETHSSYSLGGKRSVSNIIVNPEGSPHCPSENKFIFSASKKEIENVQGAVQEKSLGPSGGCQKQPEFERVASHHHVLGSENDMDSVNPSSRSKGTDVEISHCGIVSANLLPCEQENLILHRVDSAMKLTESCKLPDTIEDMVAVKSKGETQAGGKPPNDKFANGKKKGPSLFEMLTIPIPSTSQPTYFKDPISLGGFCDDMSSCLLGGQKPDKSDVFNVHCAPGFAGTSTQKDSDWPNTEQTSTSSIRRVPGHGRGNETFNLSAENINSFSKATCTRKQEWSRSKTSSMNLDLVLYKISRMRNSISGALIESPVCSESSDKWLKRLQHNVSDPHPIFSKRLKFADDPAPEGTSTVFGQELGCALNKGGMINPVKEDQPGYGRLANQQNRGGSPISSKCLDRWIGRWCQGGTSHFHATSNVEKQSSKSNTPPDDLEGQFPSIAAMAMMGRVMNKLRPCELQRRGTSVVWKTQGL